MSPTLIHMLIASLLLIVLIFLNVAGILSPAMDFGRAASGFLSKPFEVVFERLESTLRLLVFVSGLSRENELLTKQVEELVARNALLEQAKQENRILREALSFQSETPLDLVPAEVIAFDPITQNQTVTLNRGANDGVSPGQAVVVSGSILVGRIIEVLDGTSQMEIITSSNVSVNVRTARAQATGIVRGEHGLGLLFDLISQTEIINEGDLVITSGLGGLFPQNLLLGKVGEIRSSESELFQRASVVPATDLNNLEIVFIVRQ